MSGGAKEGVAFPLARPLRQQHVRRGPSHSSADCCWLAGEGHRWSARLQHSKEENQAKGCQPAQADQGEPAMPMPQAKP